MRMARIEVQDQFGRWHQSERVTATDMSIKSALQRALKAQLASRSRKVRAVDDKTGALIDILQG